MVAFTISLAVIVLAIIAGLYGLYGYTHCMAHSALCIFNENAQKKYMNYAMRYSGVVFIAMCVIVVALVVLLWNVPIRIQ